MVWKKIANTLPQGKCIELKSTFHENIMESCPEKGCLGYPNCGPFNNYSEQAIQQNFTKLDLDYALVRKIGLYSNLLPMIVLPVFSFPLIS